MALSLAPKGRHKNSPGHKPWDWKRITPSPVGAKEVLVTLSPILGLSLGLFLILGLTPQAMGLTPFQG